MGTKEDCRRAQDEILFGYPGDYEADLRRAVELYQDGLQTWEVAEWFRDKLSEDAICSLLETARDVLESSDPAYVDPDYCPSCS